MWRAVLAAVLALTPPAAALADSPLKRLTMRHELLGFEAVGRIDLDGGFCSGALIAPDLVLTAAHCLIDARTGARADPAKVRFRAGFRDGEAIAERVGARAVAHPEYRHDDTDGLRQLLSDIALLELDAPIPAGLASPFAVNPAPGTGGQVTVVSYARERASAPSWQRRCDVMLAGQGALMMSCDTHFGSSGAPVFDMRAGRPQIVSVISRGLRENGQTMVYGMEASASVPLLRSALRSGRGVWKSAEGAQTPPMPSRITVGEGSATGGARFVRP